jgi:UDP-2,3-diacylglucosamine pyrophosphatase LpxH
MMSIEDTLSHHRATRDVYIDATRRAEILKNEYDRICKLDITNKRWKAHTEHTKTFVFHGQALLCFLRHARAANRKLVQIKRLQHMLSSPNNWDGWI